MFIWLNKNFSFIIKLVIFFLIIISVIIYLFNYLILKNTDYYHGLFINILPIHISIAWTTYLIFFIFFINICINSIYKNEAIFNILYFYTTISGFIYSFLTLVTGMLWSFNLWGSFLSLDIKIYLIIILMLFFGINIYLYYLKMDSSKIRFFSFLFFMHFPLFKYNLYWYNSLHQPFSINMFVFYMDSLNFFIIYIYIILNLIIIFLFLLFIINTLVINKKNNDLKKN